MTLRKIKILVIVLAVKNKGNNNGPLKAGYIIVNNSEKVFSSLKGDLRGIKKFRVVNEKNKEQVACVLYDIQSIMAEYNEVDCPLFSRNLKLFSLTHEDILAEDSSIRLNVYLHSYDSDNNFRLRVEFDRNWKSEGLDLSGNSLKNNLLDIKKRMFFDINKVRRVAFEYEGVVEVYEDNSFCLEFEESPNLLCYYDKNGKELKRYDEDELSNVNRGRVEDYRSGRTFPWYDFRWPEYNEIHESDRWLYKGNSKQIQKIFSEAVDSAKISSKTEKLRNFSEL